jgi:4-hydroxy-4-methyl-2-oxoglutarate aldolase
MGATTREADTMLKEPPLLTLSRNVARLSAAQIEPFRDCITGWVVDARNGRGSLDSAIKPIAPEMAGMRRFVGTALPCWCGPNDNLALMAAVAVAEPGDVILCACEGFAGSGMAGDLVIGMARNKGVVAIVTDGMVRDREGIVGVGLPVFARGITPNSCVRSGPGTIGLPVVIGGVPVRAGDLVLGDADGVVVVPAEELGMVEDRVAAIRVAEGKVEAEVKAGATGRPEMQALLASDRVAWVD